MHAKMVSPIQTNLSSRGVLWLGGLPFVSLFGFRSLLTACVPLHFLKAITSSAGGYKLPVAEKVAMVIGGDLSLPDGTIQILEDHQTGQSKSTLSTLPYEE